VIGFNQSVRLSVCVGRAACLSKLHLSLWRKGKGKGKERESMMEDNDNLAINALP